MKLKNLASLISDKEHINLKIIKNGIIENWGIDGKELKYKIEHNIIDGNYNITSISTLQKIDRYNHNNMYSVITLL